VANVSAGIFNQLAAEVAPIVTDIANGFVGWVKNLGGAKVITKSIIDTAIDGAGILGDIGQKLIITYKFIELGVMKIAAVLSVPLAKMIELEGKLDLFATKRERQLAIDKELAALEQKKAILMDQNLRLLDLGKTAVQEQGAAWAEPIMKVSEYMDAMKASAETGIEIAKLTEEEKKNAIIKANQDEAREILKRMTALSSERKALNDKTVIDTVKMQSDILNNVAETEAEIKKLQAERSPSVQLAKYKAEIDAKREEDEKADAAKIQKTKETEDAITAEKIRALEARRLAEEEYRRSQIESQSLLGVFYQAENERAKESDWARTKSYMGTLNMQTAALAKHSKAMFAVNKGVSMANAVMNTAEGVTKAWSYGPILGPVLAGLVAAAGAAQIAVIAGTSYGQQSGSVASTGGSGAGDAAAAQASSNVGAPRQQAQDIIIYGDTISTDQLLRMTEQARERGVTLGGFRRE
jgi:hypothetical protein